MEIRHLLMPYFENIAEKDRARFNEETHKLFYQRVLGVIWLGIIYIPLFSLLDLVVVSELYKPFLVYRVICGLLFVGLLGVHSTWWGKKNPFVITIIMYILASTVISIMAVKMGGYDSNYYVGIVLVLVICSVILPLTAVQSMLMAILTYLIYVVPVLIFCIPTVENLRVFYGNNFFFLSFIIVTVLQCRQETLFRVQRFNMKMELEYYAKNLEIEVEKRAKKLEESELRYRELYENIVDMVILINRQGKIIMANPRYYAMIGFDEGQENGTSFIEYIHPEDYVNVRKHLLEVLPSKDQVKDVSFRIVNVLGEIFDVECNATQIKKQNKHVGFQMVIRDVTERKRLEKSLYESNKNLQDARSSTILGLAKLAEYRDQGTGAHLERIREYSKIIAEQLSKHPKYEGYITQEYIDDIYRSSILHDIGKVGIPDAILCKPSKLTPAEFDVIKRHTQLGGDALKAVEQTIDGKSFLTMGKEIAYYHHEKWDGSGYPNGLKGENIPLSTRLVALADVYDALTSKRDYKDAYTHEEAKEILINEKGRHFDPDIVDAFIVNEKKFSQIRQEIYKEID